MKTALTIAGSDSGGGAGVQADLKTMLVHRVYGMSVITALTAQNTTGVSDVFPVSPEFLAEELDSVFTDIFPDAVKIGMLGNEALMKVVCNKLKTYHPNNIVVDPVMVSTSGTVLTSNAAIELVKTELFPKAYVITPNIPEAELLTGMKIRNKEDVVEAATLLSEMYEKTAVLIKGGHAIEGADDFLLYNEISKPDCITKKHIWINGDKIECENNHGTGCTLSSAIASNLANGMSVVEAVTRAKRYVECLMRSGLNLGKGNGPLDHGAVLGYDWLSRC
ncbi:MAG: bifunctional hydroxymethylpyrimidine kinase/phosphomethylpyrimidine kinase [Lachnospiraceae bacterium]|nr:bifunctional hydroxymethylpyrimidine kinase/phosphomethylpyrimidine kinase [Lachnospiraceae bacterium]